MRQVCLSIFGNYLPFVSSPLHLAISVRLDGAEAHFQVSPYIFDWVQVQAVAGPLKDIHSIVCMPLLLCAVSLTVLLEGKPSAQSVVLNGLNWVFIKTILIFR